MQSPSDDSSPPALSRRRSSRPFGASTPTATGPPPQRPPVGADIDLLQALSEAASAMHGSLSLDEVVRVAADRARRIVGARYAATSQTTGGDGSQAISAVAVAEGAARVEPPGSGWPPYARVCSSNRPLRLDEVELAAIGDRHGRWTGPPTSGWLAAPLIGSDGRNLGIMQLLDRLDAAPFSEADEAILVQLARLASVAIENARLYEAAVDARSQLAWAAHVERVRAAELRAVIEAMGEAVLVCDARGRVRLTNPAADRMFADRPVRSYEDLISRFEPAAGAARPRPARPASDGEGSTPGSASTERPDGPVELRLASRPERWLELRVYEVGGSARRIAEPAEGAGRIAVMRDVTAARQARAQREAFLGILSHELRTPITTIYAGSKVLARGEPLGDDATGRELAADVAAEAERLFRLVEDLLVMTRVERGGLQLANEPVLLQRVLQAAIRLEAAHWPAVRLRLRGPADLPAVVGDPTYVEQVARNLLSNAAKYSPPGSSVDVQVEIDAGEVVVRVLDRGQGFQAGETDDLFELFYRSPATAAQASGAGIGLFVCRRLVTAMGGRIWARPRTGGGAEFGFALRRYVED